MLKLTSISSNYRTTLDSAYASCAGNARVLVGMLSRPMDLERSSRDPSNGLDTRQLRARDKNRVRAHKQRGPSA
jgi:hypothetical protein